MTGEAGLLFAHRFG